MPTITALTTLFLTAFLAATVIPAQSEAALGALLLTQSYAPWILIMVASIGNVLGSVVNWALGRGINRFQHKKWFPVKPYTLSRAQDWYKRYGRWSLLLSWVPFIGDAITVAAGVLRENLLVFIALVTIAKTGRYIVLALIVLRIID